MRNIRLILAYDGTDFHGWQKQSGAPSVQECVEAAIERVTGSRFPIHGSGRTDAGVHAAAQVTHFKTNCRIPCANLMKALNDILPPTVRIKAADDADLDFHARYQAKAKTYRYRIFQGQVCPPFLWRFVYHYPYELNLAAMASAARMLLGKHDFTSFSAAGEEPLNSNRDARAPKGEKHGMIREIIGSQIIKKPKPPMLVYDVCGNGFLHHMVRNIVGTLIEVGRGRIAPGDIPRILEARDRTVAGPTAPAQGLCLMKVEY